MMLGYYIKVFEGNCNQQIWIRVIAGPVLHSEYLSWRYICFRVAAATTDIKPANIASHPPPPHSHSHFHLLSPSIFSVSLSFLLPPPSFSLLSPSPPLSLSINLDASQAVPLTYPCTMIFSPSFSYFLEKWSFLSVSRCPMLKPLCHQSSLKWNELDIENKKQANGHEKGHGIKLFNQTRVPFDTKCCNICT